MNRNSAALRRTDCALLAMLALRSQRRVCGRGLARRGLCARAGRAEQFRSHRRQLVKDGDAGKVINQG